MKPDFSQALTVSRDMIHAFYIERDMEKIICQLNHKQASWFGAGYNQLLLTAEDIIAFFRRESPLQLPFKLTHEEYRLAAVSTDSCIVTIFLTFEPNVKLNCANEMHLRFSFCYHWIDEQWQIVHAHGSMPGEKPFDGHTFLSLCSQSERTPLQLDTRHTHQILQTLLDTLPVGIKIMEDSPEYPCAYINRNLLQFLGYDFEEFLSVTGGSALAFIHETDRKKFLVDLAACFTGGAEYSTEYRAVKSDGSLLHMLEWGQKIKNAHGPDTINSIMVPLPCNEEIKNHSLKASDSPYSANQTPIPIHFFLDTALELLNNIPDEQSAICQVLELVGKTLCIGRAYIALFQPKTSHLHIYWQWNAPGVVPLTCNRPILKEIVLPHFNDEEICVCDDISTLKNSPMHDCACHFSIHASLRCLLRKNDEKIGVLCVQDTESTHAWTQNEIELLHSCAKLLVNPVLFARRLSNPT